MLNPTLSLNNFKEHSLFPEFMEYIEKQSEVDCLDESEEYILYESFLTWLEDL